MKMCGVLPFTKSSCDDCDQKTVVINLNIKRKLLEFYENNQRQNISCLNTSKVTVMTDLFDVFHNDQEFNEDISCWDTSGVTDMTDMFDRAQKFDGDISRWNTSSVTEMTYMFFCSV